MSTSMFMRPQQARDLRSLQSSTMPLATTATQTGLDLDISALMNLMITMMIIVMMMKMMSGAVAGIGEKD